MKQKTLWLAVITNKVTVLLSKATHSKEQAEAAIVDYLQKHFNFDEDDIQDACSWAADHNLSLEVMTFEVDLKDFEDVMLQPGLVVQPPPENYYRVVYETECYSRDGVDAAQMSWKAIRAKDAPDPVLTLIDSQGAVTTVDLANVHAFNKITPGFVTQRYRKGEDGMYHCSWQEFTAGDEVQYERPNGESIDPPNYDYQEYNMILESEGGILLGLRQVLQALDVGGESSRQFADQIRTLKSLIQTLNRV